MRPTYHALVTALRNKQVRFDELTELDATPLDFTVEGRSGKSEAKRLTNKLLVVQDFCSEDSDIQSVNEQYLPISITQASELEARLRHLFPALFRSYNETISPVL